ncbi:MAG: Rieske 2Fe-2S domain-containing protein [Thaumarchaeota archaeon]|nr:Rieske 2Fe-2S domain-containing protein [Nitrososphaerota archaeon]
MEEDKETRSSQQTTSDAEKKPAAPPAPAPKPAAPTAAPPPAARPAPPPPRPAPPPQAPPSRPVPKDSGRRNFVKALFAIGAVLSIVPFVPWGNFLTSTVKSGSAQRTLLQKAVIDDSASKYGAAAGKVANINDLTTFPPNGHWVVTYPTSGDPAVDADNPDTFQKFELIRLPAELGGDSKKATDFVAFSKVCVHLWCSPNYNPNPGHKQYECPCHGSIYRVPDGLSIAGPASLQAFPQNAIPMMTLQADTNGELYILYPNADPAQTTVTNGVPHIVSVDPIEGDGDIGYGRDYMSYEDFIKPAAEKAADPADANVVVG